MGKKHKIVALISGGKDSCYSMVQSVRAGHEIVALANLTPEDSERNELDSYMFQTVGHQSIDLYAEAMNLPLFRGKIKGSSVNIDSNYEPTSHDEVEDLYELLQTIRKSVEFDAVCSGAILSDYQRVRVENVCNRLGLVSYAFLWRREQAELLNEMIEAKIDAVLIKVATLGLDQKHLGLSLGQVRDHLHKMHDKFGINICGEGGEYETFTLDCPLFVKKIEIVKQEVIVHSDDAFAPVAYLIFHKLSLVDKDVPKEVGADQWKLLHHHSQSAVKGPEDFVPTSADFPEMEKLSNLTSLEEKRHQFSKPEQSQLSFFAESWFCVPNLSSTQLDPIIAIEDILTQLKGLLSDHKMSLQNVVAVTLLLSDMGDFLAVNKSYVTHFGLNPPIRVCLEAPIMEMPKVLLSAIGKDNKASPGESNTMHVQSISHWAPANIGPYSQAKVEAGVAHIAGQIGLIPGSMELPDNVEVQAFLAIRHLMRILDVYDMRATNLVQLVAYVTAPEFSHVVKNVWIDLFEEEDERQTYGDLVTIVVVPRLPRDAKVEFHAIAAHTVSKIDYDASTRVMSRCAQNEWTFSRRRFQSISVEACDFIRSLDKCRILVYCKASDMGSIPSIIHVEVFPVQAFTEADTALVLYFVQDARKNNQGEL